MTKSWFAEHVADATNAAVEAHVKVCLVEGYNADTGISKVDVFNIFGYRFSDKFQAALDNGYVGNATKSNDATGNVRNISCTFTLDDVSRFAEENANERDYAYLEAGSVKIRSNNVIRYMQHMENSNLIKVEGIHEGTTMTRNDGSIISKERSTYFKITDTGVADICITV